MPREKKMEPQTKQLLHNYRFLLTQKIKDLQDDRQRDFEFWQEDLKRLESALKTG